MYAICLQGGRSFIQDFKSAWARSTRPLWWSRGGILFPAPLGSIWVCKFPRTQLSTLLAFAFAHMDVIVADARGWLKGYFSSSSSDFHQYDVNVPSHH